MACCVRRRLDLSPCTIHKSWNFPKASDESWRIAVLKADVRLGDSVQQFGCINLCKQNPRVWITRESSLLKRHHFSRYHFVNLCLNGPLRKSIDSGYGLVALWLMVVHHHQRSNWPSVAETLPSLFSESYQQLE